MPLNYKLQHQKWLPLNITWGSPEHPALELISRASPQSMQGLLAQIFGKWNNPGSQSWYYTSIRNIYLSVKKTLSHKSSIQVVVNSVLIDYRITLKYQQSMFYFKDVSKRLYTVLSLCLNLLVCLCRTAPISSFLIFQHFHLYLV